MGHFFDLDEDTKDKEATSTDPTKPDPKQTLFFWLAWG